MKKIFTIMVVAFFAANVFASEQVLWEGSWYVSWELPDGDEHKEWKGIGQPEFAEIEVGQTVYFALEVVAEDVYHQYKIDDWGWNLLPDQAEHIFTESLVAELPVTQEVKDAVAANGFAIHGHGFNVTKAYVISEEQGVENVSVRNNGIRYNLLGQPVSEDYKGVVILNGKKTIVR